jgi:hypothetical protein
MAWKYVREDEPPENGWYHVWRMADEGEGHAPAQWSGVERYNNGWEYGDWGIAQWWDVCFPDAAAAEAAGLNIPDPM